MTYLPFAILLTIGLITLTVFDELLPQYRKKFAFVNGILALCGGIIFAVVCIIANRAIYHSGHDADLEEWAGNMLSIYYQITLPVLFVLLGMILLSTVIAVFDKKQRSGFSSKVRVMASCASSIVLLIIAPFYGFMTYNANIPLYTYICWLGVGQALVMRLTFIAEYFARSVTNVKKV